MKPRVVEAKLIPIMIALSIRQPWAWLILQAGKDIENRSWSTSYRGYFLIHAAKGMTQAEYDDALVIMQRIKDRKVPDLPRFEALPRGGIVGRVNLVDCVTHSPSPWFYGRYGFVLEDPQSLPFTPWTGQLGFFKILGYGEKKICP